MSYTVSRSEVKSLLTQNIRTSMDGAGLDRLEASMRKDGQKCPILITKAGKVIDGHRRLAIALKLGWTHINAVVVDEDLTPEQITDLQTVHAFHSEALSDWDKANVLKAKKDAAGLGNKQLAEFYSIDPSEVTQLLSLFACIPEVQTRAAQGKIGRTKWYVISQSDDQDDQEESLRRHDAGATRAELRESAKNSKDKKDGGNPPERTARIRIPLAVVTDELSVHGTVTVAGAPGVEIGWTDAEDILREALKAVKDAQKRNLGMKAAQASWRDMAAPKANAGA